MANSSPMKQPPRRFRRNTLWLALMAAPLAHAQPVSLDPIQVTADREADADTVVDAETIERFQADDLEDVFAGQPDVSVGGSNSIAQKVYVRGFEDPLLNVSVDGATQAGGALFHHSGRLSVEPELLKQVEVNAGGAGRATEGAGALGGSIRFVTKDPDDLLRPGESAGGALVKFGSFSNTDGYKASGTAFGRLSDNWSTLVSVSQSDHEPFKDGSGDRIAGSDARQQLGGFAKLVGQLPADQTIKLSHEVRTDEGGERPPQRPQWVVSSFNRLYELDGRRDTTTLNYGYAPAGNALVDLEATVYHTESDIEQNVEDRWGGRYFGFSRNIGGDLRNTSRFGEHSLTYGVDYREDKVNAGYQEDKRAEQQTGEVLGVYLQGDLWLTSRLLFSAGARYDDYRLKDNDDQRFSEDEVSPNATWPGRWWTVSP